MPTATLEITLPEHVWIGEVSRTYPDAVVRILAAIPDDDSGAGLAEIESNSIDPLLEDVRDHDTISDLAILNQTNEQALVQFETQLPLLLLAARDSGVPLEMPFEVTNGTAYWTLTAPRDRLSELGEQLRAMGITFSLESLTANESSEPLLTETQTKLIKRAIDEGYYDTPRDCSLTELADKVGLAKSTASETLHRAEGKIIKQFREQLDANEPGATPDRKPQPAPNQQP